MTHYPNKGDELDAFDLLSLQLKKGEYGWTLLLKDGRKEVTITDEQLNLLRGQPWHTRQELKTEDDQSFEPKRYKTIVRNLTEVIQYDFVKDTVLFSRKVK